MTPVSGSSSYVGYFSNYANRLMNTYVALATSSPVLEELKSKLNLTYEPKVTASVIADYEPVQIDVVESESPDWLQTQRILWLIFL